MWDGLDPAQGDGRACVICGDLFAISGAKKHPVGRSVKHYEVYACESDDTACLATTCTISGIPYKSMIRPRPSEETTG